MNLSHYERDQEDLEDAALEVFHTANRAVKSAAAAAISELQRHSPYNIKQEDAERVFDAIYDSAYSLFNLRDAERDSGKDAMEEIYLPICASVKTISENRIRIVPTNPATRSALGA